MRNRTDRNTIKALLILMISVLVITGCSTSNNGNSSGNDGGKAFTSEDGQVQLTLDKVWVVDPDLSNQAILGVSERKNEKYAMVNTVLKSDMSDNATLDDFKTLLVSNIKTTVTNAEESNTKEISINSTQALIFEIAGEVQKLKVHYLVAALEKGGSFYQIVTWSTESKFKSNKQELLKAIESFKVLQETPTTASTQSTEPNTNTEDDKNTKTTTMTSDDKKMEITIPAYMTFEVELNPDADIQASRSLQEEYMMILREGKDTFADNFTLTDYYDAINGNMSQSLLNSIQTEPKEIQINGQPAIQFELTGEVDKVKISYLITIVETEGNFTQTLFWTLQNRMVEKRDMFIKAASTFKEV